MEPLSAGVGVISSDGLFAFDCLFESAFDVLESFRDLSRVFLVKVNYGSMLEAHRQLETYVVAISESLC